MRRFECFFVSRLGRLQETRERNRLGTNHKGLALENGCSEDDEEGQKALARGFGSSCYHQGVDKDDYLKRRSTLASFYEELLVVNGTIADGRLASRSSTLVTVRVSRRKEENVARQNSKMS